MNTVEFLRAMWPAQGIYVISLLQSRDGKAQFWNRHFFTIEDAASFVATERDKTDQQVYYALHSFKELQEYNTKRGTTRMHCPRRQENAAFTRVIAADFDIGDGSKKKYGSQAEALGALRKFTQATDLPRPTILSSGVGLHVYWRFSDDVAKTDWQPVANMVQRLFVHHKLRVDSTITTDAARVLRPIHTWNRKDPGNPRRVEILKW